MISLSSVHMMHAHMFVLEEVISITVSAGAATVPVFVVSVSRAVGSNRDRCYCCSCYTVREVRSNIIKQTGNRDC